MEGAYDVTDCYYIIDNNNISNQKSSPSAREYLYFHQSIAQERLILLHATQLVSY